MTTPDPEQIAAGLTKAVDDTNRGLMEWSIGLDNTGPLSREAHHICVHITAALRMLESNFSLAVRNIVKEKSDD